MTTEAKKRAKARFDNANCAKFGIKLNKRTDAEIIALLRNAESKQGLIKQALKEYMENHKKEGEV